MSVLFRPLHGALFYMELLLDKEGCHYTTDLEQFQPTLVAVFDRGINATHSVPQLEKVCTVLIIVRSMIIVFAVFSLIGLCDYSYVYDKSYLGIRTYFLYMQCSS